MAKIFEALSATPLPPQRHHILSGITKPSSMDVLIGRGSVVNDHEGNIMFRILIESNKRGYQYLSQANRKTKSASTVAYIRALGGKFLERDRSCNLWFEVGDKKAVERTERAFQLRCRVAALPKTEISKKEKSRAQKQNLKERRDESIAPLLSNDNKLRNELDSQKQDGNAVTCSSNERIKMEYRPSTVPKIHERENELSSQFVYPPMEEQTELVDVIGL